LMSIRKVSEKGGKPASVDGYPGSILMNPLLFRHKAKITSDRIYEIFRIYFLFSVSRRN
jgi:hypothetical protein